MRTVICHFYNEEYMLPWWLRHHRTLFDNGVLIDRGSTDSSVEICRTLVPDWSVVQSRHVRFDAFLNDHEIMQYELDLPGWKIALTATEFVLPVRSLASVEAQTDEAGADGVCATGVTIVDTEPEDPPRHSIPLPLQKHWGINDNAASKELTARHWLGLRNRFYHRAAAGMYSPGRHNSYHPDSKRRTQDIYLFHYGYAPWTQAGLARKVQIGPTLAEETRKIGWGVRHDRSREQWDAVHAELAPLAIDLSSLPGVVTALEATAARWHEEEVRATG